MSRSAAGCCTGGSTCCARSGRLACASRWRRARRSFPDDETLARAVADARDGSPTSAAELGRRRDRGDARRRRALRRRAAHGRSASSSTSRARHRCTAACCTGKIDILRAERGLRPIGASKATSPATSRSTGSATSSAANLALEAAGGREVSHVYCPECGFQNPEAANFCAKCGALLVREARRRDDDEHARRRDRARSSPRSTRRSTGPALVVRSGGGRAGETLPAGGRAHSDRPLARLRRLPRRRDGLAPPCRAAARTETASRSATSAASTARS